MTDFANRALLPAGLRDILPPDAAFEADVVGRLMAHFATQGYDRVKPPLIEFEESLLDGAGAATSSQTFRVMDPMAQKMMGLRADMTPQVARIATTRLVHVPRPLRLSYAGQVLRVKGTQLRQERQFAQAGIELIGSTSPAADAEVVLLTARALAELGVEGVTIDMTLPTLVPLILEGQGRSPGLKDAVEHKDVATVAAAGGSAARFLGGLIEAVGPADRALERLAALDLPPAAAAERDRLAEVVRLIRAQAPDLTLTVDPVETRGFEYQAGVAFTVFAKGCSGELGRGGRYLAHGEPATGATLFMDTVLDVIPGPVESKKVFLPLGTPAEIGAQLRAAGLITVAGLDQPQDDKAEARRLGCGHLVSGGVVVPAE